MKKFRIVEVRPRDGQSIYKVQHRVLGFLWIESYWWFDGSMSDSGSTTSFDDAVIMLRQRIADQKERIAWRNGKSTVRLQVEVHPGGTVFGNTGFKD